MAKEESYQRVPLLPLSHTNLSDPSLEKAVPAGHSVAEGRSSVGPRGRTGVAIGSALLVLILWAISIRLSWVWAQESVLSNKLGQLANHSQSSLDSIANSTATITTSAANNSQSTSRPKHPTRPINPKLIDFDIEGPANYSSLNAVCGETEFVPGRWFACDRMEGGVGNIRNEVLTCLRYAIDAGAGLVLPSLRIRGQVALGEEDLHTGGRAGLDFYFDVDYLKETLAEECPQLAIADSIYDIPAFAIANMPDVINFKDVYTLATGEENGPDLAWPGFINPNALSFRDNFDSAYPPATDADAPTIHRFDLAYFQWDIKNDPAPFWKSFGRLLRFGANVTELASEVYTSLVGPNNTAYFGAHLRFEADVGFQWGSADEQLSVYTERLLKRPLGLVYVACGLASAEEQYQNYLAQRDHPDIRVVSKGDLLPPASLARLEAMPFDQQAQVDYLVLLKSDFHAGSGASSFTANLAARRHLLTSRSDEPFLWYEEDELTFLYRGDSASFMRVAMWP